MITILCLSSLILGPIANVESLRIWMQIKDDCHILQDVRHEKQSIRSIVYIHVHIAKGDTLHMKMQSLL